MPGGCSVYGATKSGVVVSDPAMAVEFAQYGIRANAISPGHILTDLTPGSPGTTPPGPWLRERIAMRVPVIRTSWWAWPSCWPPIASSYMTGQACFTSTAAASGGGALGL